MKNRLILVLGIFFVLCFGMVNAVGMDIETLPVHWVGYDSATLKGNLTSLGTNDNATVIFEYTKTASIDWVNSTQLAIKNTTGDFTLNVFSLDEYTNYTYRAIAYSGAEIITALNNETFVTSDAPDGSFSGTQSADSLVFDINITSLGNATNFTIYVNCVNEAGTEFLNSTTQTINSTGIYTNNVTGMSYDTVYYCNQVMDWSYDGTDFEKTFGYTAFTLTQSDEETTSSVEEGINNTKNLVYAGFALLAVLILVSMAMIIIAIFNDNASISELITIAIFGIGACIVIMIGYIIISKVAQSLIL